MHGWRHPVAWLRDHPRHTDVTITVGLLAFTLLTIAVPGLNGPTTRHASAFGYVLGVVAVVPLLWRRSRPLTTLIVSVGATVVYQGLHQPDSSIAVASVIGAYSLACYVSSRRKVQLTAATLLGLLAAGSLVSAAVTGKVENLWDILGNTVIFGTAMLAGDNMRRRRERLADLEARAAAEEGTRRVLAREAVTAERQRIARELHDVVAHSLSVIVVQAGAGRRVAATRPERAAEALAAIETTGREALDEMRRLLGVLRTEVADTTGGTAAELAPQPSLADLRALAAADPSLPVEVSVEGDPVVVPAAVDLQAYRIVQEALTNVRKHAGPAQATVRVRYAPDAVELQVVDDGRGASASAGHGHGLLGMRERAALCGGELHAGPRPGGGWAVSARLPLTLLPLAAEGAP